MSSLMQSLDPEAQCLVTWITMEASADCDYSLYRDVYQDSSPVQR